MKRRYEVKFNHNGEIHTLYSTAIDRKKAHYNCLKKLSKKLEVSFFMLRCKFNGFHDNFSIKEVIK